MGKKMIPNQYTYLRSLIGRKLQMWEDDNDVKITKCISDDSYIIINEMDIHQIEYTLYLNGIAFGTYYRKIDTISVIEKL